MTKKKKWIFSLVAVLLIAAIGTSGYLIWDHNQVERYNIRQEPASPTAYPITADNSIPLAVTPDLLQNPDRGYRGELYLTLGSGNSYPPDTTPALTSLQQELENFQEDGVQVYQLYVYLIEFYNKPLSEEALQQFTTYLEAIEAAGKRVLIRFAYEYDGDMKIGPTAKQTLSHISQLTKWFQSNSTLVGNTVYALQLGFFGLWGEGHNMVAKSMWWNSSRKKIIAAVFDMVPEDMTVMVRYPWYLEYVSEEDMPRVSIHDDYLVGREDPWGMIPFDHPDNQALYHMDQHSICDGEMPWGAESPEIDPMGLLVQVKNYGLRTLSAKHNYKEEKGGTGKTFYLEQWKNVMLDAMQLEANGLPYCPAALDENGQISVFSYLQYHLGYLLAVTNLTVENGKVSFDLINYGMGAPFDFKMEVKIGDTVQQVDVDMKELGQFSSQHFSFECPQDASFAVCLRHVRADSLTIRLANELPHENGYYLLKP